MYGVMAEFDTAEQLLSAGRRARAAGYRRMDAYAPFPVEGLGEAIGFRSNAIPLIGLTGGVVGALSGYFMQVWIHTTALPINVGGRPLLSWPSFVPVTFELAVLFSALSILAGLFILNGHPEPYHPVFNVAVFARATRDRFFLCIQADDPRFDEVETRDFLYALGAREVADVPE
jgi:Alternative complex III, ActD subunit